MAAFETARVPLEPDELGRLAGWTPEQVAVMRAYAAAWPEVVARRRTYDALLRDLGNAATRPHA